MGRSRKNVAPSFVVRTYRLVEDKSIDSIISWGSCPNSFVVRSPVEFTEKFLPKFFKHKSFPSFVRQLSSYGFRSLRPEAYEFTHDNFVRFQPHLLSRISRNMKNADNGAQAPRPSNSAAAVENPVLNEEKYKDTYSSELTKFREQQEACARMTQMMCERAQRTDELEQQLMSLLGQILPSPELLALLILHKQRNNALGPEAVISRQEKSRLHSESVPESARLDGQPSSEGQFQIKTFLANLPVLPGLSEKITDEGSAGYHCQELKKVYLSTGQDGQTPISASPQIMRKTVKYLTETSDSAVRGEAEKDHGDDCEAKTLVNHGKTIDSRGLRGTDAFIVPPKEGGVEFFVQVTKPDGSGMGSSTSSEVFDQKKMECVSINLHTESTTTDFRCILETFLDKIT